MDPFKPIQSVLDNFDSFNFTSDSSSELKDNLTLIEDRKNMIINGQRDLWANELMDSDKLFLDASSEFLENYKGIEITDHISSFMTDNNKELDDE